MRRGIRRPAARLAPSGTRGGPRGRKGKRKSVSLHISGGHLQFAWATTIDQREWETYRDAIEVVRSTGVKFMLGGGFALAAFTGRWRDTKDIDFYIHPEDRDRVVEALTRAGFGDLFPKLSYDRQWIYRSTRNDVIVDIIWSMANRRARVDDLWFERASTINLRSQQLLVVPREEFMWCKLYIMQRDHCDWTDLFNLLYAGGPDVDWDHLIWRLDCDVPLLRGLLQVYGWLCPVEVLKLPRSLWGKLGIPEPPEHPEPPDHDRVRLLDSRCWFAASRQPGEKLEV